MLLFRFMPYSKPIHRRRQMLLRVSTVALLASSQFGIAHAQDTRAAELPPVTVEAEQPRVIKQKDRTARHAARASTPANAGTTTLEPIIVNGKQERGTDPVDGIAARVTSTGT